MKRLPCQRRSSGHTVLYNSWEWIYAPRGLTESTRRQIEELAKKGERGVRVIQWPRGQDIWVNGTWILPEEEDPR